MRLIYLIVAITVATVFTASVAAAQGDTGELALKRYFEGKQIIVKMDMPGTKGGVDLYPDRSDKLFDYDKHYKKLRDNGISIRNGDRTTITKIEFDDKTVEVHLDGGGFGSNSDYNRVGPTPTYPTAIPKTKREIDLEAQLKTETDKSKLRYIRSELDYERNRREEANRRNRQRYDEDTRERNYRIEQERLRGGSRFNLNFKNLDPKTLTPDDIKRYLEKYADLSEMQTSTQ